MILSHKRSAAATEAVRGDLLLAARHAFAEHGYHGATVEDIAARACVGKGTVYLRFAGGKAEMLTAVLDDHLTNLRALVVRAFAGEGTVRFRFWTLALTAATYFRTHPDLLLVHARELPRLLADADAGPSAEHLGRFTDRLVDVVAPALGDSPSISALSSRIAAHHLLATLFGHLLALGLQPETEAGELAASAAPSEVADTITALVFDGIAAHHAPDPRPPATCASRLGATA